MHFTETDEVRLKAIAIDTDSIESVDKAKVKAIIKDIEAGKGYEPVEVKHDIDHDTYTLTKGLETYLACWQLGRKWIEAEISF